jgi:hypothetical protein
MNRKFYGNQYIGKNLEDNQTKVVGTWIGIKEMFHNPGKVLLAVLMLGLASATFVETSTPHRLWIASAYADLMSEDKVEYVREVVEVPEGPELPSIFYFTHPWPAPTRCASASLVTLNILPRSARPR